MKPQYVLAAAIAATCVLALAAAPQPLPPQWVVNSARPNVYEGGVDQSEGFKGAKYIRNTTREDATWGSLTQVISARQYLGQRIRFRARVRTENVSHWAGLWLRIDTPDRNPRHFYNSEDKPIKGTTGWQERSVVLDVPNDARAIAFGVIDEGVGQVWIDNLALETVGMDVSVDTQKDGRKLPSIPTL